MYIYIYIYHVITYIHTYIYFYIHIYRFTYYIFIYTYIYITYDKVCMCFCVGLWCFRRDMCGMTHSCINVACDMVSMWHGETCLTWNFIWMSYATPVSESCHTHTHTHTWCWVETTSWTTGEELLGRRGTRALGEKGEELLGRRAPNNWFPLNIMCDILPNRIGAPPDPIK